MHCSSFSKTLAPGYRVGWVAGGRYARASCATSSPPAWPPPRPQAAIAAYLEKAASIATCASSASSWPCNRARCCRPWRGIFKGTRATRPQGGYFIWVELPERIDTLQLHRAALGHGISIAPGPLCSRPPAASATSCG